MANYMLVLSLGLYLCIFLAAVVGANDTEHDDAESFIRASKEKWSSLVENDDARKLVGRFLSNTHEVMKSENNANIMTGVTREVRTIMTNKNGAKSLSLISDGLTKILTDENASRSLAATLDGLKNTACSPETALLMKRTSELVEASLQTKYAPDVMRAIADGCTSFMDKENPREVIFQSLLKLKSYMSRSAVGDIKHFVS